MCAPVASTSRARAWDRKFRSASTTMSGPSAASRSRARVCSPTVYGPNVAPSSAPVPDSAATSQRTCGNAPSRVALQGRPKYAAFSLVSGTSLVEPSIETTRSPQQNTPGSRPAAPSGGTDRAGDLRRTACAADRPPTWPGPATARRCSAAATAGPARHPPNRPDRAARRAAAGPGGGDTARRPACSSPGRSRSCGPETATAPARSTPPAGPAAAGAGSPGCRSCPPPDPPARAGTSWSTPPPTPGRAASPPATPPPTRHAPPRDHPDRRSPGRAPEPACRRSDQLKARPLPSGPASRRSHRSSPFIPNQKPVADVALRSSCPHGHSSKS